MPVRTIDSHTGGEPTRVVISGIPDLGGGSIADQALVFSKQHDHFRRAVVNEPRGHDAMVGALLLPASRPDCLCGVIFFNNVGTLHMCIHGAIGLGATLAHMGRITPGAYQIDTAIGVVTLTLHADHRVSIENICCYRYARQVAVHVPGYGKITGDIAWGGNWFFLIDEQGPPVHRSGINELILFSAAVKAALSAQGITGENSMEIDHVECFGPPTDASLADSKNFVLCPGNAFDRSPCGTGTSAKLACMHAEGTLSPGQTWRQAGIVDSVLEGTVRPHGRDQVIPTVTGRAWITGESTYHFSDGDPFA
ncbi:MAG: proline racemase family protein, partial [Verrucomicrobia bacterium]|nr:proline racemase family protein [Verrucomicrobiota bacterium]